MSVTPTTCVVDDVEIEGAGPHGYVVDTYYPACGEAITEHVLSSGEALTTYMPAVSWTAGPGSHPQTLHSTRRPPSARPRSRSSEASRDRGLNERPPRRAMSPQGSRVWALSTPLPWRSP